MSLADERVQYESRLADILSSLGVGGTSGDIPLIVMSAINYIKAKLDELIPEGEGITFSLSSTPNITNPTTLLINSQLSECVKDICLSAPLTALFPDAVLPEAPATEISGTPTATGAKTGYIVLPGSFLRLSSLRMADWKKDIITPISPENPIYAKQQFEFRRGTPNFPVAVLNWKIISGVNKRTIEYYSVNTSHVIEKLLYIPERTVESFLTVNPNLLPALAWQCASKVLQIFEKDGLAKIAQERVTQSFNNI